MATPRAGPRPVSVQALPNQRSRSASADIPRLQLSKSLPPSALPTQRQVHKLASQQQQQQQQHQREAAQSLALDKGSPKRGLTPRVNPLSLRQYLEPKEQGPEQILEASPRIWDATKRQKRKVKQQRRKLFKSKKRLNKAITKEHPEFELTFDMMLGIRTTVGRIEAAPELSIDRHHFADVVYLRFPREGSRVTPAHDGKDFKFKDYAPLVFRGIRRRFFVEPAHYLLSLCGDFEYLEFLTNSKSGQFFFYSHNRQFMIKTVSKADSKALRMLLPHYYKHVMEHPDTLLCRIYGLHRVKLHKKRNPFYFVIMGSVFDTGYYIHEVFDLKGSTDGRKAKPEEKNQGTPIYKDLDFIERKGKLQLGPTRAARFRDAVRKDAMMLASLDLMDYSLLLGIHRDDRPVPGESETPGGPEGDDTLPGGHTAEPTLTQPSEATPAGPSAAESTARPLVLPEQGKALPVAPRDAVSAASSSPNPTPVPTGAAAKSSGAHSAPGVLADPAANHDSSPRPGVVPRSISARTPDSPTLGLRPRPSRLRLGPPTTGVLTQEEEEELTRLRAISGSPRLMARGPLARARYRALSRAPGGSTSADEDANAPVPAAKTVTLPPAVLAANAEAAAAAAAAEAAEASPDPNPNPKTSGDDELSVSRRRSRGVSDVSLEPFNRSSTFSPRMRALTAIQQPVSPAAVALQQAAQEQQPVVEPSSAGGASAGQSTYGIKKSYTKLASPFTFQFRTSEFDPLATLPAHLRYHYESDAAALEDGVEGVPARVSGPLDTLVVPVDSNELFAPTTPVHVPTPLAHAASEPVPGAAAAEEETDAELMRRHSMASSVDEPLDLGAIDLEGILSPEEAAQVSVWRLDDGGCRAGGVGSDDEETYGMANGAGDASVAAVTSGVAPVAETGAVDDAMAAALARSLADEAALQGSQVYFFGIIDFFQEYNAVKKLERFWKVSILRHKKDAVSVTNARSYADRFVRFMDSIAS